MRKVFALVLLALAGCANKQPAPAPEPQIVRVQVPVAVPCKITPVQKPAFAVDSLPLGAAIDVQMRALRAERQQRKGYEERLEAAVQACQ
jgi:hypothetical protein